LATFARRHGVRRPYVLYAAHDATSLGQARTFRGAARALGSRVVGFTPWDPSARDYRALLRVVGRRHPDALVFSGLIGQNGGQLIRDKVAVLGPNRGRAGGTLRFAAEVAAGPAALRAARIGR
jgi:branched-chain amino acid transport system substrate-binding protein